MFTRVHPHYDPSRLMEPDYNAQAALDISSGGSNWQPWSTYTSGTYRQYLGEAREALALAGEDMDRDKLIEALNAIWDVRRALVRAEPEDVQSLEERLRQYAGEMAGLEHPNYETALTATANQMGEQGAALLAAIQQAKEATGIP